MNIKDIFLRIMIYCMKFIGPFFFKKQYLKGKYFDNNNKDGWIWLYRAIFWQKILGVNRNIPWPVSPSITINNPNNIIFDVDDINNFQTSGCYFQNFKAKIYLGKGCKIACNVGIITANHDYSNTNLHYEGKDVFIGDDCWIGMNSIILPGVRLGNNTIVGAGSVVTKSFPEGHSIIAGNPAKIIRQLLNK